MLLLRSLAPHCTPLENRYRALLQRRHDPPAAEALSALSPAAAARLASATRFLRQAATAGRRLAKLNVPPEEVSAVLAEFDRLLDPLLGGRFGPAREQLQLALTLTLHEAFYQVRECEAQAFFALYRAETEAPGFDDLLRRFAAILARTFRAHAVRVAVPTDPDPRLNSRQHIQRGAPEEQLILDGMRGRHAAYWSCPLARGVVAQFAFPANVPCLPRDAALLDAAAARCREAAERFRLAADVQRFAAQARRAEEEERRRIGRDLHDEAGQSLLLLRLQLELMERVAGAPLRERIAGARETTERTIVELRRIVAALSPAVLERLGLPAALRQLGARFRKTCAARLRMRVDLPAGEILPEAQQVIYRIAQESLHNIARHAQATFVNLSLSAADMGIRLTVSDNGAGFRTDAAGLKPMSFGLAGMRERAMLLGGTLSIESAPGRGTRVDLLLPNSGEVESHDKGSSTHH